MMKSPGDGWPILEAKMNVLGLFLKNLQPFVLAKIPPRDVLSDRDERRMNALWPAQGGLLSRKLFLLITDHVSFIARDAAKEPFGLIGLRDRARDNVQSGSLRNRFPNNCFGPHNSPHSTFSTSKREQPRIHKILSGLTRIRRQFVVYFCLHRE